MDRTMFEEWLDGYAEAWETKDPEAAAALFAESGEYHVTPFTVHEGRDAIRAYWRDATEGQERVSVETEVLAVQDGRGIGWFRAAQELASGGTATTDGICVVELDADGRCTVFREWWHKRD